MTAAAGKEPRIELALGDRRVTLLGTAHVSRASAETVETLVASGEFDSVAVELCPSRYNAIVNPDSLARMDLIKVLRGGKAAMVAAQLALAAYQQRLADQFGVEPGAEQKAAIDSARAAGLEVLLIDREIGVTLKRVLRSVAWWKRFGLAGALFASLLSREDVSEEEVERLKEGDMLETTFAEFAEDRNDLYVPLIDERDTYMAARVLEELENSDHRHLLAVVGAGHLKGIGHRLQEGIAQPRVAIRELDNIPPAARWPKAIPWVIVAAVFVGFFIGFQRSPELGLRLIGDWVLINGSLSALGALLAAGHPLTVMTAFVAAPITSLNPTVGAGMATAAMEIYLRKPQVGDFMGLRHDTSQWRGWWRNRVSRTLLVFLFSTLGSAAGTYIAGFRIFDRLMS
ncbi:MAG: TraB/GumN family protein [Pseudomonadota bacterium]